MNTKKYRRTPVAPVPSFFVIVICTIINVQSKECKCKHRRRQITVWPFAIYGTHQHQIRVLLLHGKFFSPALSACQPCHHSPQTHNKTCSGCRITCFLTRLCRLMRTQRNVYHVMILLPM
ncbi:hypothetical protein V8E51_010231, partial [Hyaloscypha variabilis]